MGTQSTPPASAMHGAGILHTYLPLHTQGTHMPHTVLKSTESPRSLCLAGNSGLEPDLKVPPGRQTACLPCWAQVTSRRETNSKERHRKQDQTKWGAHPASPSIPDMLNVAQQIHHEVLRAAPQHGPWESGCLPQQQGCLQTSMPGAQGLLSPAATGKGSWGPSVLHRAERVEGGREPRSSLPLTHPPCTLGAVKKSSSFHQNRQGASGPMGSLTPRQPHLWQGGDSR